MLQIYSIFIILTAKMQNTKSKPSQKNGGNLFGIRDRGLG